MSNQNSTKSQQNQGKKSNPDFLTPEQIAARCKGKSTPQPGGFVVSSPLRPDKKPSLSIRLSQDGNKVHLHDFGAPGATEEQICDAFGIKRSQLWRFTFGKSIQGHHTYTKKSGQKVDQVRFENKRFLTFGADSEDDSKFNPYNFDQLDKLPDPVIVVESEKTYDRLTRMKLNPTTWKGGASSWNGTDWSCIKNRNVIISPDNDAPGKKAAKGLAYELDKFGNTIRFVKIPDKVPTGWDLDDLDDEAIYKILATENLQEFDPFEGRYITLSDVKIKPVDWLIPYWMPKKAITLLAGDPGLGKSTIALKIASLVSRGGKWPDGSRIKPGEVLLYSNEDDLDNTIAPRVMAMNGDKTKIKATSKFPDGEGNLIRFNPSVHMPDVHRDLKRLKNIKLLILDPIKDLAMGVRNSFEDTQIRAAIEPVLNICRERDIAVLGIIHLVKRHNSKGSTFLDRVNGSGAWVQTARAVWGAEWLDGEKAIFRVKSNLGPDGSGFHYNTKEMKWNDHETGEPIETSSVEFGDAFEGRIDELLDQDQKTDSALDMAKDFLIHYFNDLEGEGIKWPQILMDGKKEGLTKSTLERARNNLKAKSLIYSDWKNRDCLWFKVAKK